MCVHTCAAWMLRRAEENARPLVLELQVVVSAANQTWVLGRVVSSIHYRAITILLVDCFKGLSREIGGGLFCLHTRVECGGSQCAWRLLGKCNSKMGQYIFSDHWEKC